MTLRQTLPRIWLMTDPRFGDRLLAAVQALPYGSGIIFRNYEMPAAERRALFKKIRHIARRRGHILLLAGDEALARHWHADGFHSRGAPAKQSRRLIRSAPVHNMAEMKEAIRLGADLLLLSPLFDTASHPGARPLGRLRFLQLAPRAGELPVIALGGVTKRKGMTLDKRRIHGWAGIDTFKR